MRRMKVFGNVTPFADAQRRSPDPNERAWRNRRLNEANRTEERSVRGAEVAERNPIFFEAQLEVITRRGSVGENRVRACRSADRQSLAGSLADQPTIGTFDDLDAQRSNGDPLYVGWIAKCRVLRHRLASYPARADVASSLR